MHFVARHRNYCNEKVGQEIDDKHRLGEQKIESYLLRQVGFGLLGLRQFAVDKWSCGCGRLRSFGFRLEFGNDDWKKVAYFSKVESNSGAYLQGKITSKKEALIAPNDDI